MKFLRMKPGHGEVLIAEGDVEVGDEEARLIAEFRAQLDAGMWAAVPLEGDPGRREAQMVQTFDDIPRTAERVIFFPRAAGGADAAPRGAAADAARRGGADAAPHAGGAVPAA